MRSGNEIGQQQQQNENGNCKLGGSDCGSIDVMAPEFPRIPTGWQFPPTDPPSSSLPAFLPPRCGSNYRYNPHGSNIVDVVDVVNVVAVVEEQQPPIPSASARIVDGSRMDCGWIEGGLRMDPVHSG